MWWSEIEDKVFTYIKTYMVEDYPSLKCTTKGDNVAETEMPTLYLHELTPIETGQDLDNTTINAVISTIEIVVYTNTSETKCREMISKAISLMKALRFNVTAFPDVITQNNVAIAIARFRRVIGNGDKLY